MTVGNNLDSCTKAVSYSDLFTVSGRVVQLVDTPGFDDANMSDFDVLKIIAHELQTMYVHHYCIYLD